MGLTNWRGPKVRMEDVTVAKNDLTEEELGALNNLVEQYLVFATGQATRRIPMRMADWISKLNSFITINDRDILTHAGRISHELAFAHAGKEYEAINRQRLAETAAQADDFYRAVNSLPKPKDQAKTPAKKKMPKQKPKARGRDSSSPRCRLGHRPSQSAAKASEKAQALAPNPHGALANLPFS